ncbi:DUF6297 family protein [Micromonospora pattaloongensis]|uniref:DUF6297 family protein n=1 Tax=Micromonospora pattaloongensis TaxID=405436 RepID=UPI001FE12CB9|nr:DUF6297 family protein [Micromonospora pattaloongensis]
MTNDIRSAAGTSAPQVRRWIRQRQIAANGRVEPTTVYSVLLALAMAVALVGQPALALVWPAGSSSSVSAPATVGLALLGFYGVLRQLGPVVVGRGDATWLLTAPVPRRTLSAPAFLLTVTAAVLVGVLAGVAVAGHAATRPVSPAQLLTTVAGGCAATFALACAAVRAQRTRAAARIFDTAGSLAAAALLAALVGAQVVPEPSPQPSLPATTPTTLVVSLAAGIAAAIGLARAWAGVDRWPIHRIIEASAITCAYADVVYAAEPSFLSELSTRRFWRNRTGIRTSGLLRRRGIPPLLAQDLLLVRRKAGRLPWLAALAAAPAALADGPLWALIMLFLLGAMAAAGLCGEPTHSDAANPSMVRLMGLSRRQVAVQRLVMPSLLAASWAALAMAGLQVAGVLSGPWWILGVATGPAAALAAMQRARASASSIGSTLIETPFGAFPSGMLLWLVNGIDVLAVLTLPVMVAVTSSRELAWHAVLAQAAVSALGGLVLWISTGRRPV